MFGIEWWFCCLNPREREVLRATIEALLLTLWLGVPEDVWRAFWLAHPDSGEAVQDAFLSIYGLEIATIDDDAETAPYTVVRPVDVSQYVSWSLFIATPDAACLSGCQQSRVSPP